MSLHLKKMLQYRASGLTLAEACVLEMLPAKGLYLVEISRKLSADPSLTCKVVDQLMRKGFVTKSRVVPAKLGVHNKPMTALVRRTERPLEKK